MTDLARRIVFEGQFFDPIIKFVTVILCDPCGVVRGHWDSNRDSDFWLGYLYFKD